MSDEQPTTAPDSPPSEPTAAPPSTTPETPKEPTTSTPPSETKSLLNKEPAKGAPDSYTEFKVPEGYTLDEAVAKDAGILFKDMNLSQDQAQKLVDFYVKQTNDSLNQPYEAYRALRQEWVEKAKAHPEIGRDLDRVLTTVAKAIDGVGDAELAREFRQVMDMTGAGDHPSFIRMFYKLAKMVTEGQPIVGGGPSAASQRNPANARPATAASALYPNLPSGA